MTSTKIIDNSNNTDPENETHYTDGSYTSYTVLDKTVFNKNKTERTIEEIEQLILNGLNVNAMPNDEEGSLLHQCFNNVIESDEMIKMLIKNKADVNLRDAYKKTPLHDACFKNVDNYKVKLLLDAGGDINAKDENGNTPLHSMLIINPRLELFKFLISSGADVNIENINKHTALYFACSSGFGIYERQKQSIFYSTPDINKFKSYDFVKILLENGSCFNNVDLYGNTPLHIACSVQNVHDSVKLLIFYGADKLIKNEEGETPMDIYERVNKNEL